MIRIFLFFKCPYAYLPEISGRDILLLALPPAAVTAEACEVTEAACAAAAAAAAAAAGFSAGLGAAAAAAAATGTAPVQSCVRSLKLKQLAYIQLHFLFKFLI